MTIKEISDMYDLSTDTLRFYEKKGLIGPIQRTKSGIRNYSEPDLKRIEFIKCMREADLPIDVLKKYVDLFEQGDKTINERRLLLENQRTILKEKISKNSIINKQQKAFVNTNLLCYNRNNYF